VNPGPAIRNAVLIDENLMTDPEQLGITAEKNGVIAFIGDVSSRSAGGLNDLDSIN